MFCRCRGYLYFFTRVPGIFTRVPALYQGAWFVSHFHYHVLHRTLVAQTRQQICEREFWKIMFHIRAIAFYPFNSVWSSRYILKYDDKNVRKILNVCILITRARILHQSALCVIPCFSKAYFPSVCCELGLGAFLGWWPPSTMWAGPLIFLWPPLEMSE